MNTTPTTIGCSVINGVANELIASGYAFENIGPLTNPATRYFLDKNLVNQIVIRFIDFYIVKITYCSMITTARNNSRMSRSSIKVDMADPQSISIIIGIVEDIINRHESI